MAQEFDDDCRRLFHRAEQLAGELGQRYVGSEPLLLALLDDPAGRAADICRRCGADPAALRADVLRVLRPDGPTAPGWGSEWTPPAREAWELARAEAEELGDREVRAEHLLLGMVRQGANGCGVAGYLLAQHGVGLSAAREAVRRD